MGQHHFVYQIDSIYRVFFIQIYNILNMMYGYITLTLLNVE